MKLLLLKYNLQYFANETGTDETGTDETGTGDTGTDDSSIDAAAFADLISEKDKEIQQLQKDVAELKQTNAKLLVRVSAGERKVEFDTEKAILDFCDTRKTK